MGRDEGASEIGEIAILAVVYFLAVALSEIIAFEMTKDNILGFQLIFSVLLMIATGLFLIIIYSKITPKLVESSKGSPDTLKTTKRLKSQKKAQRLILVFCVISTILAIIGGCLLVKPLSSKILEMLAIDQIGLRSYVDSPVFTIGCVFRINRPEHGDVLRLTPYK